MIAIILIAAVLACLGILYRRVKKAHSNWADQGVPHAPPTFLFGNIAGSLFRTKSFTEITCDGYNASAGGRYAGMYSFMLPILILKDPDLIKQLTVKDFDHFADHRPFVPEDVDDIWGKNLFALKGKKWRNMRATLSPAFTSSKMKQLFSLIDESGRAFVKYFKEHPEQGQVVEIKDLLTRFTNDVIATTAFGIKCDSLENKENEFYLMGKELTAFDKISRNLKFLAYIATPKIARLMQLKVFSPQLSAFFKSIIMDTIKQREDNSIKRPDMINILMEAKKGRLRHDENEGADTGFAVVEECTATKTHEEKAEITDDDIAAQAMIFFFAGFETVSTCMTFMAYELAVNTEIQQKLQKEIDEVLLECDGVITYELLLKMKYLDMVVSESLRKWPPTIIMDRECNKPYTIEPVSADEKPVKLKVGDLIWLPMFAMHRDPKFYPNPERFDPERFSEENKSKILPSSYIPFGSGPRACLGSRFALLEVKTLFFHLLSQYNIVVTEKTVIPVKISKKSFNLLAEGGMWLKLEPRIDVRMGE